MSWAKILRELGGEYIERKLRYDHIKSLKIGVNKRLRFKEHGRTKGKKKIRRKKTSKGGKSSRLSGGWPRKLITEAKMWASWSKLIWFARGQPGIPESGCLWARNSTYPHLCLNKCGWSLKWPSFPQFLSVHCKGEQNHLRTSKETKREKKKITSDWDL